MLSKNEVAKLKSLHGKMTVLCSEIDGLPPKYRMVYLPQGTTYAEQKRDLINYVYEKFSSMLNDPSMISQLEAHRICRMLHAPGFSQKEVFQILRNERYQRK